MNKIQNYISVNSFFNKEGLVKFKGSSATADMYIPESKALHDNSAVSDAEDSILNKWENTSIRALVSYTARTNEITEQVVLGFVENHLGLDNINKLRRKDFEKAIRYLVDLDLKESVN